MRISKGNDARTLKFPGQPISEPFLNSEKETSKEEGEQREDEESEGEDE